MYIKITTANGEATITPVFCEVTGKHICWKTDLSGEALAKGCTPAYISFDVVDDTGEQLIEATDITTF